MADEPWTYDELFDGLDPAPGFVRELERLGLLRIIGRDGGGRPVYAPEARTQLDKVLALVELGYDPADIAAIARKVGLPPQRRKLFVKPPTYVRLTELASRSGLDVARLESWVDVGLLVPDLRTERGEGLFREGAEQDVVALDRFRLLGFSEEDAVAWARMERNIQTAEAVAAADEGATDEAAEQLVAAEAALALVHRVQTRLRQLRGGLRIWDKRVSSVEKKLERVRRLLEPPEQRKKPREPQTRPRTRRRVRTSRLQRGGR